ncbi:MAG TPA: hypothetical protein VFZ95_13840 [Steroidobacteraceae bacterium]
MLVLVASTSASEPLDDNDLAMDATRYELLVDRALEAADVVLAGSSNPRKHNPACANPYADLAFKRAAIKLLALRQTLIGHDDLLPAGSRSLKLPAWVFEPPGCISAQVLEQRHDWLGRQVEAMTNRVCERAFAKTNEVYYCSVE